MSDTEKRERLKDYVTMWVIVTTDEYVLWLPCHQAWLFGVAVRVHVWHPVDPGSSPGGVTDHAQVTLSIKSFDKESDSVSVPVAHKTTQEQGLIQNWSNSVILD